VDTRQQWAQVLAAAAAPAADREAALRTAMGLGLGVAPAAVGCSLTERAGSGFRTAATANELALNLDLVQYDADEGPCLAAAVTGKVERLDEITPGPPYPAFAAAADRHGVHSSLSIPLAEVDRRAALNFYAVAPGSFTAGGALREAQLLARVVAALLRGGPAPARVSAGDLADAQARRKLLERARAVLAGSGEGTQDDAFAVLVRRSRDEHRSVYDIAAEVVGSEAGDEVAS
jgi:hypothetical protein